MQLIYNDIAENLLEIENRIQQACKRAGRDRSDVTLMAVSKTQPLERILLAYSSGLRLFGENRVQEMQQKTKVFELKNVECHIIGTLQKNKVKYLPKVTSFIQSVDSMALAKEINKQYAKHDKIANILIQVNIGNESSKSGVKAEDVFEFAQDVCANFEHVRLRGIMCIPPPIAEDGSALRENFAKMRGIYKKLQIEKVYGENIDVLSMGMSDDFEIAIEEGSTLVRVGSAIFGARDYNV